MESYIWKFRIPITAKEHADFFVCTFGRTRPPKPFTADQERNRLWVGTVVPVVKGDPGPVSAVTAFPPVFLFGRSFGFQGAARR